MAAITSRRDPHSGCPRGGNGIFFLMETGGACPYGPTVILMETGYFSRIYSETMNHLLCFLQAVQDILSWQLSMSISLCLRIQHGLKCSFWGRRWKKTLKASSYRLLICFDEIFRLVFCQCGVGMDSWTFACIGHEVADLFFLPFTLPILYTKQQNTEGTQIDIRSRVFTFTKETIGLII